jgi:hypothetical protein
MQENAAFLTRLRRIVGEAASREERNAHVVALFNSYKKRLYSQLDIGASNRPSAAAKTQVDHALADLREKVLDAEVTAIDSSAGVFTTLMNRIEMARRALAIRIPIEDDSPDGLVAGMRTTSWRIAATFVVANNADPLTATNRRRESVLPESTGTWDDDASAELWRRLNNLALLCRT